MTVAEHSTRRPSKDDFNVLAAGPWCWPVDEHAIETARPGFRPAHEFGVAPFLTVTANRVVSLLLVAVGARQLRNLRPVAIEAGSLRDVAQAAQSLELFLPRVPDALSPHALFLDHLTLTTALAPSAAAVVEGRSFGLAAMLAATSRALRVPVPSDVIAIAAVSDSGALEQVDDAGLRDKVQAVGRLAPRVRRVIVAEGQAVAAGAGGHKVLVAGTVRGGLELAWNVKSVEELVALVTPAEVTRLARELVDAAVFGKGAARHYEGTAAASRLLRGRVDVSEALRALLAVSEAVANRHTTNSGAFVVPADLRSPMREVVVAHWLQQLADAGVTEPDVVRDVAAALAPDDPPASEEAAKAHGALARLWAVTGHPRDALQLAQRTAQWFVEVRKQKDASYALCAAFHLAGVLEDRAAFDVCVALTGEIERELDDGSAGFVRLARARGAVLIDEAAIEAHQQNLEELWSRPQPYRWHVSTAAGRLLARTSASERDAVCDVLREWTTATEDMKPWIARVTLELIRLDEALSSGDRDEAEGAVAALVELDPGVFHNLRSAPPPSGRSFPEWIARAYPY